MSETSRFPQLALPFAITGAAGGWLSAGLVANPLVRTACPDNRGVASLVAALAAALTGALVTRLCTRERLVYELDDGELAWAVRAPADNRLLHAGLVLAASAATGAVVAVACDAYNGPVGGAFGGLVCGALFLPVCFAVITAGRNAKRARHGSLVAGSDGRAVWGILATCLSVMSLLALPDWPASTGGAVPRPLAALGFLALTAVALIASFARDTKALRRARKAIVPGLVARDPDRVADADAHVPSMDLGLGDALSAHVAHGAAAYRSRERTLALVRGDPERTLAALRRALRRSALGLVLVVLVAGAHSFVATSDAAQLVHDERTCEAFDSGSCARAGEALQKTSPLRAARYFDRACGRAHPTSCLAAAELYEAHDPRRADELFGRACTYELKKGCLHFSR